MTRKTLEIVGLIGGGLFLLAVILGAFSGGKFGATWAGGTSHTNSKFDAVGGFSVNGTDVITSSTAGIFTSITNSGASSITGNETITGSLKVGGGTPVVKIACATSSQSLASLATNASTTFDVALTGAATSSNQVYSVGNATTTAQKLLYAANPTSTPGFVTVHIRNDGAAYAGDSVFSVCYTQF